MEILHRVKRAALFAIAIALVACAATGAEDVDHEFEFAAKLIEAGLPDYAEMVVNRVVEKHPDQEDRANVIRAEALVALRRLPQAEDIASRMDKESPKTQAIWLAIADGHFLVGDKAKSRAIYEDFFKRYKDEPPADTDLLRFYTVAAHKFGQMLAMEDDPKAAADIYGLLLVVLEDREMKRQIKMEQAELLLRAARTLTGKELTPVLDLAEKNCNEVIWDGKDLWFGRAVTSLAEVQILRGRNDGATRLLRENLRMLKKLDEFLKESGIPVSESPFAGARSLLGQLYREEADTLTGTQAVREAAALGYLERALAEYEYVWGLIVRVHKRDVARVERKDEDDKPPSPSERQKRLEALVGTKDQRRKPFEDMAAALKEFKDTVTQASGDEWSQEATAQATAFTAKLTNLLHTVEQFPMDIGTTLTADMALGERFAGREFMEKARPYMEGPDARQERGVQFYVRSLKEYYNVFVGYPGSEWSEEASEKVAVLKARLKELTGTEPTIETTSGGKKKLGLVMLKEGDSLHGRKEYDKAVEQYMAGLNSYPEGDEAVVALIKLIECHVALQHPLQVQVTGEYLAERFNDRPEAPQGLLRVGRMYFEKEDRAMYEYVYEMYLRHFPKHQSAPAILYMLGEQRWKAEDYASGRPYYLRLIESYPNSFYYLKSLNRMGWSYYLGDEDDRYEHAVKYFSEAAKAATPGKQKAQAKLCLADSYRQKEDYLDALKHYHELSSWLSENGTIYTSSSTMVAAHSKIHEQATFFQAYCLSRIEEPADKVPAYRTKAVELYRSFVARFPRSELAPTALSSLGAVLLAAGKSEEAAAAYEDLAARYPDTEAGQNAKFAMIRSLLEIGQTQRAQQTLRDMLATPKEFPVDHFLKVGLLMAEFEEHDSAALALKQATETLRLTAADKKEHAEMEQRALLGLGKAESALARYADATRTLDQLIERYPRSGLFYEARFLLGRAYKLSGKPAEAEDVLRDVFKRANDQDLINRATIELAEIQIAKGEKKDALASYQRIVLLQSPEKPKTRPIYEVALAQSVTLFAEMERWAEALENCDRYLVHFPNGKNAGDVRKVRTKARLELGQ